MPTKFWSREEIYWFEHIFVFFGLIANIIKKEIQVYKWDSILKAVQEVNDS